MPCARECWVGDQPALNASGLLGTARPERDQQLGEGRRNTFLLIARWRRVEPPRSPEEEAVEAVRA